MDPSIIQPMPVRKTTLLRNTLVPFKDGSYRRHDVLLHDGKIADITDPFSKVRLTSVTIEETIECSDMMLLSGFVNAHTHSIEHWARGLIEPLPLELWIVQLMRHEPRGEQGWFGVDSFSKTPSWAVGLSALHTGIECLLSGSCAVLDHLFVRDIDDIEHAVHAYKALGIRAFIAPMLDDDKEMFSNYVPLVHDAHERNKVLHCCCDRSNGGMASDGSFRMKHGEYDPEKTQKALALWEEAVEKFHNPSEGIEIVIGPVTTYNCSMDLLVGAAELRKKYNLCGHTHVLETRAQAIMAKQFFPSGSAIKQLQESGFLQKGLRGTSLAHTVWLTDEETDIIASCDAVCVHNPLSNLRLGSGIFPLTNVAEKSVKVAMGCDGACSSDGQDMLEVLKMGTILTAVTDADYRKWCTARHMALELASKNGYAAVGMEGKAGQIEVGMEADVTLWDLTSLALLPRTDPLALLILGSRTQAPGAGCTLHSSWVQGKRVVADGSLTGISLENFRKALINAQPQYRSSRITDPQSGPSLDTAAAVEREYRAAMGLDKDGQKTPMPKEMGQNRFPPYRVAYDSTIP